MVFTEKWKHSANRGPETECYVSKGKLPPDGQSDIATNKLLQADVHQRVIKEILDV